MSYHRRYKLKDDRFGLLALTLREKAGLTQSGVAHVVGGSERTIRHWEGGTAFPDAANMKKLIELYLRHGAFAQGRELEEAKALWEQATESASRRKTLFDEAWFTSLLKQQTGTAPLRENYAPDFSAYLPRQVDWGEAIDVTSFYGRESELALLKQWVVEDRCRLVLLLGRGGIGKTSLSIRFAQEMMAHFDFVLWRTLLNSPPLQELLADCMQTLSEMQYVPPLQSEEKNIALLIELLRKRRCLLVLDNVESILESGRLEGGYRQGYEGYSLLFRRAAQTPHQSCLLLTSREMLTELEHLEGKQAPVRSLRLLGLGHIASQELLNDKDLFGTQQDWEQLVLRYSGNPLALKIVATSIRDLFGGDIAAFLHESPMKLHTLQQLLQEQFFRLTPLEHDILYWLAIERDPVSLETLSGNLSSSVPRSEILYGLQSLWRRSLIDRVERTMFTLQPEVMEYVSERLVEQASEELVRGNLKLLITHALMKAQSSDYIRESQARMLVQPLLNWLRLHFGSEQGVEQQLLRLLSLLREQTITTHGYSGGNLLNLLACLKGHLRAIDFSSLAIRQAYLQGIEAQDANFAHAHFSNTLFTEPIESIASMALSPDGKYLAVGSFSGRIRVWRIADREPLLTLQGHSRMVWSLAFSPDGTLLASGGYEGTVKLWELRRGTALSGRCLKTLVGHERWVRSSVFSPDGSLLITGGDDGTIRIWDIPTGKCANVLTGHSSMVWSLALSPDGTLLVSGGHDETVRVWDIAQGKCLHVLRQHTGIVAVAFHPRENLFASGGEEGLIHLWDARDCQIIATLQLRTTKPSSMAFNAEGTLLASGSQDGAVEVWHIAGENVPYRLRTLPGHPIWVGAVAFGAHSLLASISYGGKVKLWEVESGRCVGTIQGYSHMISTLTFSPDDSLLAQGDDHGMLKIWDVHTGHSLETFQAQAGCLWSLSFSPDGRSIAVGGDDLAIKQWKVESVQGKESARFIRNFYGHTTMAWSVAFSTDGKFLASSGLDWTVKIWNVANQGRETDVVILEGHHTFVWTVAFSPDGKKLATGDNDGIIKVWNSESGECLATLQNSSIPIGALIFKADGKTLLSASSDGAVTQWNTGEGGSAYRLLIKGQETGNWPKSIAFNHDGTLLAIGGHNHSIQLWPIEEYSQPRMLALEEGQVWSVAFSPDSQLLASGDDNGNVALWNVETGACLRVLHCDKPYERMNIYGVKGITETQKSLLKVLGAIESASE